MNSIRMIMVAMFAMVFVTLSSAVFAQGGNLVIRDGSSYTGTGTLKVKANIDNSNTTGAVTIGGTVELFGTSAQNIGNATKPAINFATVKATGVSTKTFNVNSTVSSLIDVAAGTTAEFDLNGKQLTLQDQITNTGLATTPYKFDGAGGLVVYSKDGAQTIYGTTYASLQASATTAAQNKNPNGNLTVNTNLTVGGNVTVDFSSNSFTFGGATNALSNASTATLRSQGSVTITDGATVGGTFEYYSGSSQNVASVEYNNLTLSGAGGKTLASAKTTSVAATYSLAGGARTYTGSTFRYNGTTQTLKGGESYNHLTIVGGATDAKTADGAVTVGGDFTNTTGITDMVTYALSITGAKNNTGTVKFAGETNGVLFTGGTVEYNGTTVQAAAGQTIALTGAGSEYNNLLFTNNATKKITGGIVRSNSGLTIASGVSVDISASGDLRILNGDLDNSGSITNAGTITVGQ